MGSVEVVGGGCRSVALSNNCCEFGGVGGDDGVGGREAMTGNCRVSGGMAACFGWRWCAAQGVARWRAAGSGRRAAAVTKGCACLVLSVGCLPPNCVSPSPAREANTHNTIVNLGPLA